MFACSCFDTATNIAHPIHHPIHTYEGGGHDATPINIYAIQTASDYELLEEKNRETKNN